MKSRLLLASVICAVAAELVVLSASAGSWDGYTTISFTESQFTSATSMVYYPDLEVCPDWAQGRCGWFLAGEHWVDTGFMTPISQPGLSYRGTLQGPASRGQCATASSYAYANFFIISDVYTISGGGPWSSSSECVPLPPQCRLSVTASAGGALAGNPSGTYDCNQYFSLTAYANAGYHFVNWDGDIYSSNATIEFNLVTDITLTANFESDPPPPPQECVCGCAAGTDAQYQEDCSPIVINLSAGDYALTGGDDPVFFDISGTGVLSHVGWTARGADEAFLWMDRNGNGRVDDGSELFGTATRLQSGVVATNGFEALKELDTNQDGVIDKNDFAWWRLMLWRDLNHDGIEQADEIEPVSTSDLVAIDLKYHWEGRRDLHGNLFKYGSKVWLVTRGATTRQTPVYDIFFVAVP